ncbi:MAG TPA: beta-galactosidase GalA [Candidatus Acidoferrales bacterium]|jgi:beta-galactosidase|nr:beta-galactosidase GalA [Candidatus Acidoferrales bacterium]
MKFLKPALWQLLAVAAVTFSFNSFAADAPREHLSLDANWKFHMGDDWPNVLRLDKAGQSTGPAAERFGDQAWRSIDLPHDWAIELPFDKAADTSHGFKPVGPGFPKNSTGWYRRTFELPAADAGKRIWLQFDGAFRDVTVWVNGWEMVRHESGYFPFRCDITDITHIGGTNTVSVKVDATKFEGWFYEGAGIYRHVWLDKTAPVAIAPDGIFVYSQFKNNIPQGKAKINIEASLLNTLTNAAKATVKCEIISPDGKVVAKDDETENVRGLATRTLKLDTSVSAPALWSPESPKLYKLVTTVSVAGKTVDRKETEFGIRTVAFDTNKGFLLNGQPYELKGTCNHQDMAGVGAALPDALQYFRIAKLKEFGDNAYRTSHNPPTTELLEACDRLGMIVMDENRLLGSDEANMQRFEDFIRRDRNHASVGIWSICNEESTQTQPVSGMVGLTMQNKLLQMDSTRPVTAAESVGDVFTGLPGTLQVRGWNYHIGKNSNQYGREMDSYHRKHPNQPEVGTEQGSTVSTRGIYENDKQRGYVSAYDDNAPSWANTAEEWYSVFATRPWLSGGFVWTGFDYRGEPTPYAWPCVNSHFGIIDVCGFPKDIFYYYQAWWTTNTVLHLLPHWNWAGKEGQEIRVDAFSNCKEVELFLNGESLGKQTVKPYYKVSWQVKYAPGILSAKGYNDGKVVAEQKIETTGDAVAVQLTPNRSSINADGEDVSVFTVSATDARGRAVPVAQNMIHFEASGDGKILGVGNGDPSCHEPDTFIPNMPVHSIPVNDWRWKLTTIPNGRNATVPEYAPDFDDSTWNTIKPQTDGDTGDMILKEGESAVYRAHVKLTEDDLKNPGIAVRFAGIDDRGWIFVNNVRVGESRDWSAQPVFDIKKQLHAGDNVIAVGVRNESGTGGLNPDVNVEITGEPVAAPWSRSLFNGLAQIIVQSSKTSGEIKLTASADGLTSATATVQTVASPGRPSVP